MGLSSQIVIIIPGKVVPKQRPRFSRRGAIYTPAKTTEYEKLVGFYTKKSIKKPFEVPVQIGIVVTEEPPRSWSQKKRQQAINGEIKFLGRSDVDNYAKSILDGMNKIAYVDDRQVIKLYIEKKYGAESKATIVVRPIIEDEREISA